MNFAQVRMTRRSVEVGAALVALVSLAIGAHAALSKRADAGKPVAARMEMQRADGPTRIALVIGNGHYPDAGMPLAQPINDARAMTAALRRDGFEVDVVEDAGKDDMTRAIERLKARVTPQTVVMLYFGGFGVQAGRENYMLPVDATIWKESDVRREGVSVEAVLTTMAERGAQANLMVLDASRRNPYERRFRRYSHGLGEIKAPANALVLSSATPGSVAEDAKGENSALVAELLSNMKSGAVSAEALFSRTRAAVAQASDGEQVPSVTSSLVGEINLGASREASAGN